MDFDIIDQLLIRYSAFIRYWRRNESTVGQYISYLQTSRRGVLYTILIEFGIPMKLVRLIKVCLKVVNLTSVNICMMDFLFRIV